MGEDDIFQKVSSAISGTFQGLLVCTYKAGDLFSKFTVCEMEVAANDTEVVFSTSFSFTAALFSRERLVGWLLG